MRRFQRRLLAWYRAHGRKLPWRRTRDPYRILVSEIMLQQTQVDRVKGYLPPLSAPVPDLRRTWPRPTSRRCASPGRGSATTPAPATCTRTARIVVAEHGGRLPDDAQVIRRLPGIGRYTAGAVLSIAYGQDEPILDTNAARVLTRVFARARARRQGGACSGGCGSWPRGSRRRGEAGDFNQAIMDLGATICRARSPDCADCPVRASARRATRADPRPRRRGADAGRAIAPLTACRAAAVG